MSHYLSEMDLVNLERLKNAEAGDWCRALWALSALKALRMDEDDRYSNAQKIRGTECGAVRKLIGRLKNSKPETWQFQITQFAKESPVVRPKDSYPIPSKWGLEEWSELKKEAS